MIWLFTALWSLGLACFGLTRNIFGALQFVRMYYIAAMLIAPSFLYFCIVFPYPTFVISVKKITRLFFPSLILVMALFVPDFMIGKLTISDRGSIVNLNFGYYIYSIVFIAYIILGFTYLSKKYRSSEGINRIQLKYVISGMLFGFLIGTAFNLFFPLFGDYQLIWIGPYSTFIVMGSIFYLISRK